jgi:acyl-CoA thioesterase FadM
MYPILRLARVIITSKFKKKLTLDSLESDIIKLRVLPQDIDPFMELNNGRYVTLLDLGRFGYGSKVNMGKFLKKNNWSLTIVGTYNEYRHRLRLFQKFELKTKIIGYDNRWFYFSQKIERNNKVHMASVVKFAFTSKEGIVSPEKVIPAMGKDYNPDLLPIWIKEISKHQLFKKFA